MLVVTCAVKDATSDWHVPELPDDRMEYATPALLLERSTFRYENDDVQQVVLLMPDGDIQTLHCSWVREFSAGSVVTG